MDPYPRADYDRLARYQPDQSPIAVDLSDNRNLWGAHPSALAVLAAAADVDVACYPGPYGDVLTDALAGLLEIAPESITTGGGGSGVLDATMRACAPTEMRLLSPGWPAACALAFASGHTVTAVPWAEGLADPERFAGNRPAIVFVANPNNPTGESLSDEWIREVQRYTERTGSILIVDEAYGEYARPLGDRTPFDIALAGERTICAKTLSKAYGLAGLRVGYGVAHPDLILEIDKARGPFTVSRTSGKAGAAAVSSDSDWLANVVLETRTNRQRVQVSLEHRGYDTPPSAANFIFVRFDREEVHDLAQRLERVGVRARPFAGPELGGSGLRATVAPWDQMQRLLDGLDLVKNGTV